MSPSKLLKYVLFSGAFGASVVMGGVYGHRGLEIIAKLFVVVAIAGAIMTGFLLHVMLSVLRKEKGNPNLRESLSRFDISVLEPSVPRPIDFTLDVVLTGVMLWSGWWITGVMYGVYAVAQQTVLWPLRNDLERRVVRGTGSNGALHRLMRDLQNG